MHIVWLIEQQYCKKDQMNRYLPILGQETTIEYRVESYNIKTQKEK